MNLRKFLFEAIVFICVLGIITGCAKYKITKPPKVDERYGRLAIAPAGFMPESNFSPPIQGSSAAASGAGAATGAAWGGLSSVTLGTLSSGGFILLYPPVTLGVVLAGGVVGGVAAGKMAVPEKVVSHVNEGLASTRATFDAQQILASLILDKTTQKTSFQLTLLADAGPRTDNQNIDYTNYAEQGIDTVIEQKISRFTLFGGSGKNPYLRLLVEVWISLLETSDGSVRYKKVFTYESENRRLNIWLENDASLLLSEARFAIDSLAERIVDELFFVSDDHFLVWGFESNNCWLRPIYPGSKIKFFRGFWKQIFESSIEGRKRLMQFMPIDSLQPTLRWESFPQHPKGDTERQQLENLIKHVTYDLKVLKLNELALPEMVYSKTGLNAPEQKLETPLEPSTRYYWTFRARYTFNGKPRMTRWARSYLPWDGADTCFGQIPYTNYYRFETKEITEQADSDM